MLFFLEFEKSIAAFAPLSFAEQKQSLRSKKQLIMK
jgi:hypothetical protein